MPRGTGKTTWLAALVAIGGIAVVAGSPVWAQNQAAESPPPDSDGGPSTADSNVGYIDSAIPGNQLRLRLDAAYRERQPSRAEFFYPKSGPAGPGLPRPETRIDYQELSAYGEFLLAPHWSAFLESPVRFLNPEINANATGFGDLNAGFKWAFLANSETTATFQLRGYAPTGDARRGLGNGHATMEPALLFYQRLTERLTLEAELRDWIPIGGTDFAGNVLRYGIGCSYGERSHDGWWLTPVAEIVGWTVLGGKEETALTPTDSIIRDAAGDTIVNAKLGVRVGLGDRGDVYAGYGRALTGDTWYKDTWRLEFRLRF